MEAGKRPVPLIPPIISALDHALSDPGAGAGGIDRHLLKGLARAQDKGNDVIVTDEKGGPAKVTQADLVPSNGVILVVDKVLLPK